MSAPMPDFVMPGAASERSTRRLRLPRGPGARRAMGIGIVVAVVAGLAVVGVPALVEQQRGRDAVAIVERYASVVADGDVEAAVAALEPDASIATDDLLLAAPIVPSSPLRVEGVELVSLEGDEAIVRVDRSIGPDAGSSEVRLVDDGGWRVADGLLGTVQVGEALAHVLGVPADVGMAWMLPGRYEVPRTELGAVAVQRAPFSVHPGEVTGMALAVVPSQATTQEAIGLLRARLAACGQERAEGCPAEPVDLSRVVPALTWDLDLARRDGTMAASMAIPAASGSDATPTTTLVTVELAYAVTLSDDLQAATFAPIPFAEAEA